jgi:hypothetical protein
VGLFYKLSQKTLPFLVEMQFSKKKKTFLHGFAFLKKGHIEKKLGPLFLDSACISDVETTFQILLMPKPLSKFWAVFFSHK